MHVVLGVKHPIANDNDKYNTSTNITIQSLYRFSNVLLRIHTSCNRTIDIEDQYLN